MNKGHFFLYASLGIIVGGGMPTNVNYNPSDIDKKYQQTLLYVHGQMNKPTDGYSKVSQIVPKKDYRSRYANLAKSKAFIEAYSGKSLGDFIKIDY